MTEKREFDEKRDSKDFSLISLRIEGNEDGMHLELVVQSPESLKEVEEVFVRLFEKVKMQLHNDDNRVDVI